jgi:NitT/TauT family transport system substrate-binding protein
MMGRRRGPRRRRTAALCGAAALVMGLMTACGGGASGSVDAAKPNASGLTEVNVGIIPIVAVAPLALGVEKGYFKDEGLDVKLNVAQGGAALVPAVMSGQYDFAFSNNVSLLLARAKGLKLSIVSAANSAGNDPQPIEEALAVPAGSPITSPAQLAGKTIAVNTLNNIVEVANRATLEAAGVDASTVKFIEVGFPDMPLALEQGRVDAADVAEPFLTKAKDAGATVIAHPFRVLQPNLYISSWFSSDEFVKAHPDVVAKFTRALDKAKAYSTGHPEEIRGLVPGLLKVDPALAQKIALAYWPEGLPAEASLGKLHESLVKLGLLNTKDLPDPNVLLHHE